MKSLMKFQKKLTLITIIVAVLTFVYALVFNSGSFSDLMEYSSSGFRSSIVAKWFSDGSLDYVDVFLVDTQTYVGLMVTLSIVLIVIAVLLNFTHTNTRRNYYISNYINLAVYAIMAIVICVISAIWLATLIGEYSSINFDTLSAYYYGEGSAKDVALVTPSYISFILGFVDIALLIANIGAWIYMLIWKGAYKKWEKGVLDGTIVIEKEVEEVEEVVEEANAEDAKVEEAKS